MAKALLGHLGGSDPLAATELIALRRRVAELQAEVVSLREQAQDLTLGRLETELARAGHADPPRTDGVSIDELSVVG